LVGYVICENDVTAYTISIQQNNKTETTMDGFFLIYVCCVVSAQRSAGKSSSCSHEIQELDPESHSSAKKKKQRYSPIKAQVFCFVFFLLQTAGRKLF